MATKISKDKTRSTTTEFELRCINADGDAVDVHHFETAAEAKAEAPKRVGCDGCVATVIEKHVAHFPAWLAPGEPDIYTTIETSGDKAALEAGGWI